MAIIITINSSNEKPHTRKWYAAFFSLERFF